jgi:hypothetical protein
MVPLSVSDHQKRYFSGLEPEGSNIIRARGANHHPIIKAVVPQSDFTSFLTDGIIPGWPVRPLTARPSSGRRSAATWTADAYSISASAAIVDSVTAIPHAVRQSGVGNGWRPIAVTSKASQAEKPTAAASGAIGAGLRRSR